MKKIISIIAIATLTGFIACTKETDQFMASKHGTDAKANTSKIVVPKTKHTGHLSGGLIGIQQ